MPTIDNPATLKAERILLLSGVSCVFLAMALGVVFAFFVSHVANAGIRDSWLGVMSAVSDGNPEAVREHFAVIKEMTSMRGRAMNSHSHLGAGGLLAMLLAILLPLSRLTVSTSSLVAWGILSGVVLQFTGVLSAWFYDLRAIHAANLGGIMLFAGVALVLYGLYRRDADDIDTGTWIQSRSSCESSRLLIRGGITLLLVNILLGMYLAWLIASGSEAQSLDHLALSVEHLMKSDVEAARSAIASFKFLQAKSAINAAAHSHGLIMALFMLLLAILRPRINLGERLFKFCSIAYVVLSFAFPLWIFLAINVWFDFRLFANYTGILLAGLTLLIIIGIVRQTGNTSKAATPANCRGQSKNP